MTSPLQCRSAPSHQLTAPIKIGGGRGVGVQSGTAAAAPEYPARIFGPAAPNVRTEPHGSGVTGGMTAITAGTTTRRKCARCGAWLARDNSGLLCAPCAQSHRGDSRAPRLRPEFWRTDRMRGALATRDMGAVVRAYRTHPAHGRRPLSQADVAEWLGITQGQLSRIESGRNRVRDYDKLVRYARRLHIPAELLWFDLRDPTADQPTAAEPDPDGGDVPPMVLSEPALADALLVTLRQNALIDNLTGSRALLPVAVRQMGFINEVLAAEGGGGARLLGVAARFAEHTGWLHQECGDLEAALRWSDTALELAERAEDSAVACYVRMRKSYIAGDAGRRQLAIDLADEAVAKAGPLSVRLKAFVLRQRAQGFALAGDYDGCARALDQAFEYASDTSGDGADLVPYCTSSYIEMEAAQCWITLGRPDLALTTLRRGLPSWRSNFRRDFGLCLARLAAAHAGVGEPGPALDVARQAITIARETGSHRTVLQLRQATDLLTGVGAAEQAEELRQVMWASLGRS